MDATVWKLFNETKVFEGTSFSENGVRVTVKLHRFYGDDVDVLILTWNAYLGYEDERNDYRTWLLPPSEDSQAIRKTIAFLDSFKWDGKVMLHKRFEET
jgi:hypothetical protein